jgi:hypothetical protein
MKAFLEEAQQDRLRGKEKGTAIAVRDPPDTDDSPDEGEAPDFLAGRNRTVSTLYRGRRVPWGSCPEPPSLDQGREKEVRWTGNTSGQGARILQN